MFLCMLFKQAFIFVYRKSKNCLSECAKIKKQFNYIKEKILQSFTYNYISTELVMKEEMASLVIIKIETLQMKNMLKICSYNYTC